MIRIINVRVNLNHLNTTQMYVSFVYERGDTTILYFLKTE